MDPPAPFAQHLAVPCCRTWATGFSKPRLLQFCSPPSRLQFQGVLSLMDLGSCP